MVNTVLWVSPVRADLNWKVELILLIRSDSVTIVGWIEDGIDTVSKVISPEDSGRRVEGEQTYSRRAYFFVKLNSLLN